MKKEIAKIVIKRHGVIVKIAQWRINNEAKSMVFQKCVMCMDKAQIKNMRNL